MRSTSICVLFYLMGSFFNRGAEAGLLLRGWCETHEHPMNPAQVEIVPLDPGLKESYLAAVRATSAEGSTYYKTTRYHKLNAKGFYSVKFPAFPAPVRMVVSGMDRPEGEFLQALGVYLRTQDPALLSKVEEIYVTQWYSLTSFNVKAEVSDDAKTLTVYLNGLGSLFKDPSP